MATELKPIVIDNFQKGVSKSPYTGFSAMVNLNIGVDGAISQNRTLATRTAYSGFVRFMEIDSDGNIWELTSQGKLYKNGTIVTGNTVIGTDDLNHQYGCGLAVYNGYVYVSTYVYVERYNIAGGTWETAWQSYTDTTSRIGFHPMVVGVDDVLYIAHGNYIASYNGTTWTEKKCTLPKNNIIRSIVNYGDNIFAGTQNIRKSNADIYSWDRQSNLADLAVRINENGVNQMIVKNNTIYVVCGEKGTIYSTVGTSANKLVSIADHIYTEDYINGTYILQGSKSKKLLNPNYIYSITAHPGAIAIYGDKILIGYGSNTSNQNTFPFGIWSYNVSNGAMVLEYLTSVNRTSLSSWMDIGQIYLDPFSSTIYWSWRKYQDGTITYGNDNISNVDDYGTYNNNYSNYFITNVYQVGLTYTKRTFNTLTVSMSHNLVSGQGIQIKYREKYGDTWITLGEFTDIGKSSKEFPFAVSCETIQVRVEFKGATSPVYQTPELLSVVIK